MNYQRWVRHNKISVAMIIYVCLFIMVNVMKPAFMYNPDGTLKEFGLGFRRKTVIPLWLISIVLAIVTYFSVLYYSSLMRG